MTRLQKLERRFGRYAIPHLMYYIIAFYLLGYFLEMFGGSFYATYLSLDAAAILKGQIWRIVTFIIQPPSNTNLLFLFFVLYFYYMIGTVLEQIWGAFRFNLYFFSGVLLHVVAALLIYVCSGINLPMSTYYLNLSLFMAFAVEQPDMVIYLFFLLPVKIKWLAWIDAALFALTILEGYLFQWLPVSFLVGLARMGIYATTTTATAALISMLNFFLFAILYKKGPALNQTQKNFRRASKAAFGQQTSRSRRGHSKGSGISFGAKHRCAVCGRTEKDGDDLVFRFCSKCDGNLEYCQDHLYTHIHVKKNTSAPEGLERNGKS